MTVPSNASLDWSPHMPSKHFSTLDIFSRLSQVFHRMVFKWSLPGYTILFLFGILMRLHANVTQLESWIQRYYSSSIHMKRSSEACNMLMNWMAAHDHYLNARSTIARIRTTHDNEVKGEIKMEKALCFDPYDGRFWFRFQGTHITYQSKITNNGYRDEEIVTIRAFGKSLHILKKIMLEAEKLYQIKTQEKTKIFENYGDDWRKVITKPIRPLSSIIVGKEQQTLVSHIGEFLNSETYKWFVEKNLPYRQGYLLYGPPGTGKSSFSLSVAGNFKLDVYIIDMTNMTDQTLQHLFNILPRKCIVLLEDIDAISTSRSTKKPSTPGGKVSEPKNTVSLSGLLNAIDGIASAEGRILIMTTNHPEQLDEALIRPGRVDKKVKFELSDSSMIARFYDLVYGNQSGVEEGHVATNEACQFAKKVPEHLFSSAEVLSYLREHRLSKDSAFQNVDAWVEASLREYDSFSNYNGMYLFTRQYMSYVGWAIMGRVGIKTDHLLSRHKEHFGIHWNICRRRVEEQYRGCWLSRDRDQHMSSMSCDRYCAVRRNKSASLNLMHPTTRAGTLRPKLDISSDIALSDGPSHI